MPTLQETQTEAQDAGQHGHCPYAPDGASQAGSEGSDLFGAGVKNHFPEQVALAGCMTNQRSSSRTVSSLYLCLHSTHCNAALSLAVQLCKRDLNC